MKRRFPETPDFVGRLVRETFGHLVTDLEAGIRARYPDVTGAQTRVLTLLDRDGVRMVELAERAQVTKQSLSETIDALERRGLVERRPDPADGRAKLVVPTAAGERAMQHGLGAALAVHDEWTALIGEHEMAKLMRSLQKLLAALSARDAGRTAAVDG